MKRKRVAGRFETQVISNRSILAEVQERETFLTQKKTKKERQKEEQIELKKAQKPIPLEPEEIQQEPIAESSEMETLEVFDYEQMREDYGW